MFSGPLIALAMTAHYRYLSLNFKELYFKDLKFQLNFISNFLKIHYQTTKTIPIYGKITDYKVYFMGEIYAFYIDGNLKDDDINEAFAWISLK